MKLYQDLTVKIIPPEYGEDLFAVYNGDHRVSDFLPAYEVDDLLNNMRKIVIVR